MIKIIITFFLITISLNANTIQQQKFLEKIANTKNISLLNTKNILNNELKIEKIMAKENYTLDIKYKTYFNNLNLTNKFKKANLIAMKKKFCRNKIYKVMEDGLKIDYHFYNHNDIYITSFRLDKINCQKENLALNNIKKRYKYIY